MTVVCSWCSTEVADGVAQCPNCGANLVPDGDPNVPGVTAVDAASIIRSKTNPQPRNRLLSWISGEYEADLPSKAEAQAIAPPDDEVRREILRLELEAEVANLQAEADALRAEAVAEGRTIEALEDPAAESGEDGAPVAAAGEATADTAAATDEPTDEGERTA
jgi:hypothetical protein